MKIKKIEKNIVSLITKGDGEMIETSEVEVRGGKIYPKGSKEPLVSMSNEDMEKFLKSKKGKKWLKQFKKGIK